MPLVQLDDLYLAEKKCYNSESVTVPAIRRASRTLWFSESSECRSKWSTWDITGMCAVYLYCHISII